MLGLSDCPIVRLSDCRPLVSAVGLDSSTRDDVGRQFQSFLPQNTFLQLISQCFSVSRLESVSIGGEAQSLNAIAQQSPVDKAKTRVLKINKNLKISRSFNNG